MSITHSVCSLCLLLVVVRAFSVLPNVSLTLSNGWHLEKKLVQRSVWLKLQQHYFASAGARGSCLVFLLSSKIGCQIENCFAPCANTWRREKPVGGLRPLLLRVVWHAFPVVVQPKRKSVLHNECVHHSSCWSINRSEL